MRYLIKHLEFLSLMIAIVSVVLIMLIVSLDAILRYSMNSPLQWASELVRYYLMVMALYFALSATFIHNDHVSITLISDLLPHRVRVWLDVAWCLMAATVFLVLAYANYRTVAEAYAHTEFISGYVMWPSWLSFLPIPLGSALIALRLIQHSLVLITRGENPDSGPKGEWTE